MMHGRTNDNGLKTIVEVFGGESSDERLESFFHEIGGRSLADLHKENPRLLVFPSDFESVKDDIKDLSVFHVAGDSISTGNVMGFVGMDGVSLSISSRFYSDADDFFLHYLLQKVVGFHVVDLPPEKSQNPIWDFLPYLFPSYFMAAWQQGVLKTTRRFEANDDRIKGAIDVARHIRKNVPFQGKVAYFFTERTPINPVNQLIRLTVDVLEHSPFFKAMFHGANKSFNDAIRDLKLLVPMESLGNRSKIIKENLRSISHPFYSKYKPLQRLCLAILRHEKISFGEDDKEVVGLLFEGAWLWEEYLATIMPKGMIHTENKLASRKIYAIQPRSWEWYPDFHWKNDAQGKSGLVLDAKYKHSQNVPSSDQHQIVSYMYVLKADVGGFIYPEAVQGKEEMQLNGYGGRLVKLCLPIPRGATSYREFSEKMARLENEFKRKVEQLRFGDPAALNL